MSLESKQARVVVYSKDYCPYCVAAMNLLNKKGVQFDVIDVQASEEQYEEMLKKSSPRRTVPQIFINDQGIGGYDEMKQLELEGKLEELLFP